MVETQERTLFEAEEREERWIKVSVGLMRFEPEMMPLVQQLGRLDVRLIVADERWGRIMRDKGARVENSEALHEHITQSYLWVLGAYEAIRTLSQMMKGGKEKNPVEVADLFQRTKKRFARIRMPLAKMEAASGFESEDGHIAYPGLHQQNGVAWQLNEGTIISRRELSDAFLESLEFARVAKLREQARFHK